MLREYATKLQYLEMENCSKWRFITNQKGHMVDCLEVGMKNKEDFIKFLKIIKDNSNINEIQKSENTIYLHSNNIEEVQREVMQGLIDKDLYPIYIRIQEPTLERLFMEAIK